MTPSRCEWDEGERDLFWILDDLHIPNPVSPMFFDIGGWWLTCDHMFRRFGTPFASDWIVKNVNGYVYHAAVPADPTLAVESSEYQARYAARVPRGEWAAGIGAYLGAVLPALRGELPRLVARSAATRDRAQLRPHRCRPRPRSVARRARRSPRGRDRHPRSALEDPLDAELRTVLGHDGAERHHRRGQGRRRPRLSSDGCRARSKTATGMQSRLSGR